MRIILSRVLLLLIASLPGANLTLYAQPKPGDAVLQINTGAHMSQISESVMSPDGRYIITVSTDKTICIWDIRSRKLQQQIRAPKAEFNQGKMFAVAISPDNKWLAVGGFLAIGTETDGRAAGQIRIYDFNSRQQVLRFNAHNNVVTALRFSSDGKYLLSGGTDSTMSCWKMELKSGKPEMKLVKKIVKEDMYQEDIQVAGTSAYTTAFSKLIKYSIPEMKPVISSPITNGKLLYLAVQKNANLVATVNDAAELVILDTLLHINQIIQLDAVSSTVSISPDGNLIIVEGDKSNLLLFRKQKGSYIQQASTGFEGGNLILGSGFINADRFYASGGNANLLQFYKLKNRTASVEIETDTVLSNTGRVFNQLAVGANRLDLKESADSQIQFEYQFYPGAGKFTKYFAPDSNDIVSNTYQKGNIRLEIVKNGRELQIWSDTKKNAAVIRDGGNGYYHTCATITRNNLIVSGAYAGFLDIYDSLGNILASLIGHDGGINAIGESPDGFFLYSTGIDQVTRLWDLREIKAGIQFKALADFNDVWTGFFRQYYPEASLEDPGGMEQLYRLMLAKGDSANASYLLKPQKLEPRLNIFIARNNEWVMWNNKGYFKASPNGASFVGWYIYQGEDKNADFFTADKLYDNYYRPDIINELAASAEKTELILQKARAGGSTLSISEQVSNMPALRLRNPAAATTVTEKNIRLQFEISNPQFISDFILFHNGKRVAVNASAFRGGEAKDRSLTIELVPGENRFTASLLNQNKVETTPLQFSVQYQSAGSGSSLYIFTIGIDKYRNSRYNLNYARADVSGVSELLQRSAGTIFKSISIDSVFDEKATLENIAARISELKKKIKPEDVFLFYFAGHGVMSEASSTEKPDFYLVLYPVTQMIGNSSMLEQNGLPAARLKEMLLEIPAQKQLVIFDACNSGGAMNVFTRGGGEEAAISQLARSTGFTILASTNQEQFAAELSELKHGIFTYALLQGLKGEADLIKDGKITVKEIELYLNEMIPLLSEKYKGIQQFPQSYSRGMDFPLILQAIK